MKQFTSIEICAGGGGQALGLELAGFQHVALVEEDKHCCGTLRLNRPDWNVIEGDVREFSAREFEDIDLFAGGVPCPPFSKAGKQLGSDDERDLFPEAVRLISECMPKTLMLENVRGFLDPKFETYRNQLESKLNDLGYKCYWKLLTASEFGVPQLRPRTILIGIRNDLNGQEFQWPEPNKKSPPTVGQAVYKLISSNGWKGASKWKEQANKIGPTVVGGSKKHGGPDLGPTRAKRAWAELGVCGLGIANEPPEKNFVGMPRLTNEMVSILQGFPTSWEFFGKKTASYRQIGNAFPPPVAKAVGLQIIEVLNSHIAESNKLKKRQKRTSKPVKVIHNIIISILIATAR